MGLLPLLAQETIEKDIWYPTILGILVVVAAVVLFCGSVYLLLGTNFGARLGFLVAFTGLMAFMVLLTALWVMTGSPLNTLKGRIPSWKPQEVVTNLGNAKTAEVRDVEQRGREVSAVEAANVKAAADENLVAVEALPGQAQAAETAAKFAQFQEVTEYKVLNTYEIGGSSPNPLDFELTHSPLFAVLEFCEVSTSEVPFGVAPPEPECASGAEPQFLVLERDLGSLRVPPIVAFVASVLLFGLGLLALHWRERDEKAASARGALAPARS